MMPYSGILDSELYGGAMYNEFFGLKENPFSISPDPQYFYMSKGHIEAFRHLLKGITEGGSFVILTG